MALRKVKFGDDGGELRVEKSARNPGAGDEKNVIWATLRFIDFRGGEVPPELRR
jgi:hypothetical protein